MMFPFALVCLTIVFAGDRVTANQVGTNTNFKGIVNKKTYHKCSKY